MERRCIIDVVHISVQGIQISEPVAFRGEDLVPHQKNGNTIFHNLLKSTDSKNINGS